MASLPLSVLDLSPISIRHSEAQAFRDTVELAQCAERLGYHRYWVVEHHNIASVASTAPEIMVGQIARTSRMRIGSGGIMFPNHAPLLGLGFAFAHHINPKGVAQALDVYRSSFQASRWLDRPRTILTAQAICGETNEEAENLASTFALAWIRLRSGRPTPLSPPEEASAYPYSVGEREMLEYARLHYFAGGPVALRDKLLEHLNRAGADELMIITTIYGHAQRMHSYELIAKNWPL